MRNLVAVVLSLVAGIAVAQSPATQDLIDATEFGGLDYDKIVLAVQSGADVNYVTGRNSIVFRLIVIASYPAVEAQHDVAFKSLLYLFEHGAKLQYADAIILYLPTASGRDDVVQTLLANGASATSWPKEAIGDGFGLSPIQLAASGGYAKIMGLLQQNGAAPLPQGDLDSLRLVGASEQSDYQTVGSLLKKGVYVNYQNPSGETALSVLVGSPAFRAKGYSTFLILVAGGADSNLPARGSLLGYSTPLNLAVASTSFAFKYNNGADYARMLLETLLKQGAYVSGTDDAGLTPLHIAAKYDSLVAARILILAGSKVMPKDAKGKTPLDYAKSAEMIKLLKDSGAHEQ